MTAPTWTPERVARLKVLWGEGYSAGEIARDLGGVSRSAVIGKAQRLGLGGRQTPSRLIGRPRGSGKSAAIAKGVLPERHSRNRFLAQSAKSKAPKSKVKAAVKPRVQTNAPVPFLEGHDGICRFPVSGEGAGLMICGAPRPHAAPGSYCQPCRAAVAPAKAKARDAALGAANRAKALQAGRARTPEGRW